MKRIAILPMKHWPKILPMKLKRVKTLMLCCKVTLKLLLLLLPHTMLLKIQQLSLLSWRSTAL